MHTILFILRFFGTVNLSIDDEYLNEYNRTQTPQIKYKAQIERYVKKFVYLAHKRVTYIKYTVRCQHPGCDSLNEAYSVKCETFHKH